MRRLWAPWRAKYILGSKGCKGCFLCRHAKEKKKDRKNYVILRSRYCFAILNLFPYNNGHTMVTPYRHIREMEYLSDAEMLDLIKTTSRVISMLKKTLKPHAFNVGMNLGRVAGAGLEGHFHIHIVPRWNGDTNFMPVIAGTKVISMSLEDTYKKLKTKISTMQSRYKTGTKGRG